MTLGENIKKLREERKWSQIYLAQKMHINNSVLSRIEAGKREVEVYLLNKFADIFEVSTDYLLGRTSDPTPPEKDPPVFRQISQPLTQDEQEYVLSSLEMFREIKAKYFKRDADS